MNTKRVVTLMYHRIGEARNAWEGKYCVSPGLFAAHMRTLSNRGMNAVGINDFVAWLDGKRELPEGSFLITFDDGFRGVRDHALPVLEEYQWPATVFLVSDLIGKQDEWTRSSNPDGVTYPLLDAEEILDMTTRGISFHSHTRTHPSLPTLDDAVLNEELVGSRAALQTLLGRDVEFLAYPFGHSDDRVEAVTQAAGYRAAFSTQPGYNRRNVNRFRLRRIDVFGTDTPSALLRKIRFGSNDGSVSHAARYYLSRLNSRFSEAS
ncbi:MAG: polysaccharide deacetylase family protein [Thiobacillaceae bacterium]